VIVAVNMGEIVKESSPLLDNLEQFLDKVKDCHEKLNEYNYNLEEIQKLHKAILGLPWSQESRKKKSDEAQSLRDKNEVIQKEIQQIIRSGYRSNFGKDSTEEKIKKDHLEALVKKFQECIGKTVDAFNDFDENLKKKLIRAYKITGSKLSEEQIEEKIVNQQLDIFASKGIYEESEEARKQFEEVKQRNDDLLSFERMLKEVLELFHELQEYVEHQGEVINRIETKVDMSEACVENGLASLRVARVQFDRLMANKRLLYKLIAALVIIFLIIVIASFAGGSSGEDGKMIVIVNGQESVVEEPCDPKTDPDCF